MDILVVGAGMYVCGRGTDGFGTILPALYQAVRDGLVDGITITTASSGSIKQLKSKIKQLNKMFAFSPKISCLAGARAYKNVQADAAIVSVPDHLHTAITSDLLKRKIHCLVVKPLAPTLAEVKKLIRLQKENGVYGAVEFHKRYDLSNLKLKDVIRQGLIGDPLCFIVEYSQRKSIPLKQFRNWVEKSNIFQYLGIHYVDIIYFATGATPLRAMAIGQSNFLKEQQINTFDSIEAIIEWRSLSGKKFVSSFHTNWIDPEKTSAMSNQRIKVIGTKGRFEADQKNRGIRLVTDGGGIEEPNPYFSAFYGEEGSEDFSHRGYGNESIRQFLSDAVGISAGKLAIKKLENKRPTFEQSLVPVAVIEAVNKSLRNKSGWIEVKI